jgi:hypothetical protein
MTHPRWIGALRTALFGPPAVPPPPTMTDLLQQFATAVQKGPCRPEVFVSVLNQDLSLGHMLISIPTVCPDGQRGEQWLLEWLTRRAARRASCGVNE